MKISPREESESVSAAARASGGGAPRAGKKSWPWRRLSIALAIALSGAMGAAQAPQTPRVANTEVYLANFGIERGGVFDPINISNSPDYDNQPSFTPDGKAVLFSSMRDGKQRDIYRYDLASRQLTQLTRTVESEYSPLVTPDGKTFSVVRVEADNTQRLWRFDLDGNHPRLVLDNIKPVGYHVWVDATHVALFVLGAEGQPATLQYADTTTGKADIVETGIGRSLHMRPRTGHVTFVSKPAGSRWTIKEFDPTTRTVTAVVATVDENTSEDFAWNTATGFVYMAKGSKVFVWAPRTPDRGWTELADLSQYGIDRITRLAFSPSGQPGVALVAERY